MAAEISGLEKERHNKKKKKKKRSRSMFYRKPIQIRVVRHKCQSIMELKLYKWPCIGIGLIPFFAS